MYWTDRHGTDHPLPSLGGNTCNKKSPIWTVDQGKIGDKHLLPITGIKYGSLVYETQQMNITISGLICDPSTQPRYNQTDHIVVLEKKVADMAIHHTKALDLVNETIFDYAEKYAIKRIGESLDSVLLCTMCNAQCNCQLLLQASWNRTFKS